MKDLDALTAQKMHSDDRIMELQPKSNDPKTPMGLIDRSLFTGENKLHVVMDPQTTLWVFKYEHGVLPAPLREISFTSFSRARDFAEQYFGRRNVVIKEIVEE